MFSESELLPLSGLQHLAYCERQWALIHLEQFWSENRLTVEGRHMHEQTDEKGHQSRRDVRIVRSLQIHSLRLGLSGKADTVEFHRVSADAAKVDPSWFPLRKGGSSFDAPSGIPLTPAVRLPRAAGLWQPFPVEYKRGRTKAIDCDRVQLCAQALCLEEMLSVQVPAGALFYGRTRRREPVSFDERLRGETESLAQHMHELFRAGKTPLMVYDAKRCDHCSLLARCAPRTTGARRSVEDYLSTAWDQV